ncbi:hypothetical protein ACP6EK_01715 [Candidatus Caldatribacterium sp. SIUC1]|uniref:hypothetical protein n=1 Tax=Candidatus Caldatribacterium sp. SIUC1 TaxID=3418365 RepID=UPI003F68E1F2
MGSQFLHCRVILGISTLGKRLSHGLQKVPWRGNLRDIAALYSIWIFLLDGLVNNHLRRGVVVGLTGVVGLSAFHDDALLHPSSSSGNIGVKDVAGIAGAADLVVAAIVSLRLEDLSSLPLKTDFRLRGGDITLRDLGVGAGKGVATTPRHRHFTTDSGHSRGTELGSREATHKKYKKHKG